MTLHLIFALMLLFLILSLNLVSTTCNLIGPFDAIICREAIILAISQNSTILKDLAYFLQLNTNVTENIALTRRGCELFYSTAYKVPSNSGPRLLAWFIPILVLVSSIQYPEIRWKKYILLFTVLGNPILLNLSLLKELDNGRSSRPKETPYSGTFRAYTALLIYLWQVVAAFVKIIGGAPKPSGGMLGPAMLLSWLIPMVLLSNAVGWKASREPDGDQQERGEQQDSSNWSNITLLHRPDLYYSAANRDS